MIIAPSRRDRPRDLEAPPLAPPVPPEHCPFCPGHEAQTTPEILAYREPGSAANGPGWLTRVVSNRYPALLGEGSPETTTVGNYERRDAVGAHEVVIESPDHARELSELPVEAVTRVLRACRERMRALERDPRFRYVLVFKNHGVAAGASLGHGHAQIIATPMIPQVVEAELLGAERYRRERGRCVFCDIAAQERRDRARWIDEVDGFVAVTPWAPRFPFETWILPAAHEPAFQDADDATLAGLAGALRATLARLRRRLEGLAYNLVLHTAPSARPRPGHYHWHVEIIPKITPVAGFEWGTGIYIVTTPPEEAARALREEEP